MLGDDQTLLTEYKEAVNAYKTCYQSLEEKPKEGESSYTHAYCVYRTYFKETANRGGIIHPNLMPLCPIITAKLMALHQNAKNVIT